MKLTLAGIIAMLLCSVALAGCAGRSTSTALQPHFRVVSAHWLLCPGQASDLRTCCPQPADPRRCVMPLGSAPTDLVAFGRFVNAGGSGGATATFTAESVETASCRAAIPFTESGAPSVAWCSLGQTAEPASLPKVVVSEGGG